MRAFVFGLVFGVTALTSACTEPQEPADSRPPKSLPLAPNSAAHEIMALDDPVAFSLSPDGFEMAWIQPLIGGGHEYRVAPTGRPDEAVAYTQSAAGLVWTERTGLITGSVPATVLRPGAATVRQRDLTEILEPIMTADRREIGIGASQWSLAPIYPLGASSVITHGRGWPAKRIRLVPASTRDRILTQEIGLFDTSINLMPLPGNALVVEAQRQESPGSPVTHWLHHPYGDPIALGRGLAPALTLVPGRPADSPSSIYAYRHHANGDRQLVLIDLATHDEFAVELDVGPNALHGHFSDRDQILTYVYERPGQPWPVPLTQDARLALELAVSHDMADRSDLSFEALSISKASRRYVFRRIRADGRLRFVLVDLPGNTVSEFQFVETDRRAVSVDALAVEASDGLQLPAYLYRPDRPRASRLLVVALHGGPMAHDRAVPDALHSIFLDHGLDVLAVNYRGSTGQGFAHERAGDREFDRGMIDDVNSAITAAIEASGRPTDTPVLLFGGSFGGHLSFATARSAAHNTCALIAVNPASDLVEFQRLGWRYLSAEANVRWQQIYGAWFEVDTAARLSAASAVTRPADWDTPIAVITGENDVITPERMVSRLADIYADDFFTPYRVVPNVGHSIPVPVLASVLNETISAAVTGPCASD